MVQRIGLTFQVALFVDCKQVVLDSFKMDEQRKLLMFVTGLKDSNIEVDGRNFETVLLSLTGDINLQDIGKLTDKMDLPGGKQLKKAGSK